MEIRYFTGYLRDLAQKGNRGPLAHAARMLVPYIKRGADTPRSFRATIDSAFATQKLTEAEAARLRELLVAVEEAWKNTDQTIDVRTGADWINVNNGHRKVQHLEVAQEDSPNSFS